MTYTVFAREGWITSGNPNHYSGDGLMLRELRARARDTDPDAKGAPSALQELEEGFVEEHGEKLTETNASKFDCGISDIVADFLSDMAPEGYVFEIRKNRGNSNYGYFRTGPLANHDQPWITHEELIAKAKEHYGDAGVHAVESSAILPRDYELGYEHCLALCLPALEEELIAADDLQ